MKKKVTWAYFSVSAMRSWGLFPLCYVCMTQYDATMPNVKVAFPPQSLKNTLGQYLSDRGLTQ